MRCLIWVMLLVFAVPAFGAPDFTDREAAEFIQNRAVGYAVPLGATRIMQPGTETSNKERHFDEQEKTWAVTEGHFTQQIRPWIDLDILQFDVTSSSDSQSGHLSVTERGHRLAKQERWRLPAWDGYIQNHGGQSIQLFIPEARVSNVNVGSNRVVEKGLDTYRVLMGTMNMDISSIAKQYHEMVGTAVPSDKKNWKYIYLLKFDPFASRWRSVAYDWSPVDEDFPADNVRNYLSR